MLKSIQRLTCRRALPAQPEPLSGVRQMRNNSFLNSFHWNEFYFSKKNTGMNGGAKRNRTADLLNAIQALSQLSDSPETWVAALGVWAAEWRGP